MNLLLTKTISASLARMSIFMACCALLYFLLVSTSSVAQAQTYTLLEPLPCIPGEGVECTAGELQEEVNFEEYVQYVFNLLIALAAVAAVFMIVWGGFLYVSSDSFNDKKDGIKKVENALYGLLLILCSYLILRTIDPRLVAIPVTLVEPLVDCTADPKTLEGRKLENYNFLCLRGGLSNFFDQLTKEAEKFQVENTQSRLNRDAAKQKAASLEIEKKQLEDNLELLRTAGGISANTDPRVLQLQAKIANINNKINEQKAIAVVETRKAGITNVGIVAIKDAEVSASAGRPFTDDKVKYQAYLDTMIKSANDQYNKAVSELNALGIHEIPQSLNDTRALVRGELLFQKIINNPEVFQKDSENIELVETVVKNANIIDPEMKARLDAAAAAAIEEIKKH